MRAAFATLLTSLLLMVMSDGLDFSEPDFVTVTVFDSLPRWRSTRRT